MIAWFRFKYRFKISELKPASSQMMGEHLMDVGEMLYVMSRDEWRKWLAEHHRSKKSLWSIHNIVLALKMLQEGKMSEAGKALLPKRVLRLSEKQDIKPETIGMLLKLAKEKRHKILENLMARELSLSQLGGALQTRVLAGLMRDHIKPLLESELIVAYPDPQDSRKRIYRITDLGIKVHDMLSQLIKGED